MQTRTLKDKAVQEERSSRLQESHIAPLTNLSDDIAMDVKWWTLRFDPANGGVESKVLFLLESPGPKVSKTGFISQDNPDQTAENMTHLLADSGLSRSEVVLWNIVPWQMSEAQVVTPKRVQLKLATPYTLQLLKLLPELSAVVLLGRKAQHGWKYVELEHEKYLSGRHITIFNCPHPSPLVFSIKPAERIKAIAELRKVAELIK